MRYLLILTVIIIVSCVSINNYCPEEITENIPKGASKIIVTSELSKAELYNQVLIELTRDEVPFHAMNQEMFIVNTDYKFINSGTFIKMNILVEEKESYSKATMIGSWTYGQQNAETISSIMLNNKSWFTVKWGSPFEKQSIAMAYIVNLANKLNHTTINYK